MCWRVRAEETHVRAHELAEFASLLERSAHCHRRADGEEGVWRDACRLHGRIDSPPTTPPIWSLPCGPAARWPVSTRPLNERRPGWASRCSMADRPPFDPRPKLPQLVVEPLVAAVEMVDVLDDRAAFGGQAGQHQRGAGAEIAGRDPRAAEPRHAGDDGRAVAARDLRPQAVQFGHVQKSAGKHAVFDAAGALGHATPAPSTGPACRWECRDTARPTMSTARSRPRGRRSTRSLRPRRSRPPRRGAWPAPRRVLRHDADDGGRAAGDRRRHQQRGGLDAVGNQPVRRAAELLDALDADRGRAQPFDSRPQGDEKPAQIDDFRLDGRAADRR